MSYTECFDCGQPFDAGGIRSHQCAAPKQTTPDNKPMKDEYDFTGGKRGAVLPKDSKRADDKPKWYAYKADYDQSLAGEIRIYRKLPTLGEFVTFVEHAALIAAEKRIEELEQNEFKMNGALSAKQEQLTAAQAEIERLKAEVTRQESGRLIALQAMHEAGDREEKLRKRNDHLVNEAARLGAQVEELMKVDYWQDRHDILKCVIEKWIAFEERSIAESGPYQGKEINDLIAAGRAALGRK